MNILYLHGLMELDCDLVIMFLMQTHLIMPYLKRKHEDTSRNFFLCYFYLKPQGAKYFTRSLFHSKRSLKNSLTNIMLFLSKRSFRSFHIYILHYFLTKIIWKFSYYHYSFSELIPKQMISTETTKRLKQEKQKHS